MNDRSVAGDHRRTATLSRGFVQRARRFVLRTGVVAAVLAASFAFAPAALAANCNPDHPYPPTPCTVVVTPRVVEEGGTVTVMATGFDPGSQVSIDILSHVHHLGTTTADNVGDVLAQVTLPGDVEEGTHVIRLTGHSPDGKKRVLEGTVRVVEDDHAHAHGRAPSSSGLASTGTPDIPTIGLLAAASLSGAAMTIRWARRRRRRNA